MKTTLPLLAAFGIAGSFFLTACTQKPPASVNTTLAWQFDYDDADHLRQTIDPAGRETIYRYEQRADGSLSTMEEKRGDGQVVRTDFDDFGRRTKLSDANGETRFTWAGDGRLEAVQRGAGPRIAYAWDALDRLRSLDAGEGRRVAWHYDFLGRPASLETPGGKVAWDYDAAKSTITRILPNGIQTVWQSAPDSSLASLTHRAADGGAILRFTYSYRPDGRIAQIKQEGADGTSTIRLEYDTLGRLTLADDSRAGRTGYRYDAAGNRLEMTPANASPANAEYDWAGRITTLGARPCTHDAAGNLVEYPHGDAVLKCSFDAAGRLDTASSPGGAVKMKHDGEGRLVSRAAAQTTTGYTPDPLATDWRPLIAAPAGDDSTFFVWQPSGPLAAITGGRAQFFLEDHLGSVRAVVDGAGAVIERRDYDPFGVPRQPLAGRELQPGFAGLFHDPVTGLLLTRTRACDPALGRFLQRDPEFRIPLGDPEDLNAYAWCANDPVNFTDRGGAARQQTFTAWSIIEEMQRQKDRAAEESARIISQAQHFQVDWGAMARATAVAGPAGAVVDLGSRNVNWYPIAAVRASHIDLNSGINLPVSSLHENAGQKLAGVGRDVALLAAGNVVPVAVNVGVGVVSGASSFRLGMKADDPWDRVSNYSSAALSAIGVAGDLANVAKSAVSTFRIGDQGVFPFMMPRQDAALRVVERTDFAGFLADRAAIVGSAIDAAPDAFYRMTSDAWNRGRDAFNASTVGGVHLHGAGEALENLGALEGLMIKPDGGFVLLAGSQREVGLPPLRLDEMVTVFRNVYERGEAPFVSIDPDPQDPTGSVMHVRLGRGTEDTYVGWVLFEADRVMKGYSLGEDNVTREAIKSRVPGYASLFDLDHERGNPGTVWERFWIVPAAVTRRQANFERLSLFDVPLKVNTERMELRGGKPEPASDPTPSAESAAFSRWFTERYDQIAGEYFATPPKESGQTEPVPVFAELHRIALLAAIAERLRDDGVPLPAWMVDYRVAPFRFALTTPAIDIEKSRTQKTEGGRMISTRRIHGGVSLSPEDNVIQTIARAPEAESIAPALKVVIESAPLAKAAAFESAGQRHVAVSLPGSGSRDVLPCRLVETDLAVPLASGGVLSLTRHAHSFFRVDGEFGEAWTLDLPRLSPQRRPVHRTDRAVTYAPGFGLHTPLNSIAAAFTEVREVPEVSQKLLAPAGRGELLGVGRLFHEQLNQEMETLFLRDGRRWLFDSDGHCVGQQNGQRLVAYRWQDGRLHRIEAFADGRLEGHLRLTYDARGKVQTAQGSDGSSVTYTFDGGRLAAAVGPSGRHEYRYTDGMVAELLQDGKSLRRLEYGENGRLSREWNQERETKWDVARGPAGLVVTGADGEKVQYDSSLQPLRHDRRDGTSVQWERDATGTREVFSHHGREQLALHTEPDGSRMTWKSAPGGTGAAEFDPAGRVTRVLRGMDTVLRQEWRPDGRPGAVQTPDGRTDFEYSRSGVAASFVVRPPDGSEKWLRATLDAKGRIKEVSDQSGLSCRMERDASGLPREITSAAGTTRIERDPAGNVTRITAPDVVQTMTWDSASGAQLSTEILRKGQRSLTTFVEGRPAAVQAFDGGVVEYIRERDHDGLSRLKEVRVPAGNRLSYSYDGNKRPTAIDCGSARVSLKYDARNRLTGIAYSPAQ